MPTYKNLKKKRIDEYESASENQDGCKFQPQVAELKPSSKTNDVRNNQRSMKYFPREKPNCKIRFLMKKLKLRPQNS